MPETPPNPYVTGGPLADPTQLGFYGRQDIFDFVRANLNAVQRNPILLYGQRRIGKTSILRQLTHYLPDGLVPIYFDLQGKALRSLDEVLFMLAREIRRHPALSPKVPEIHREEINDESFTRTFLPRVFEALGGDRHRLVLLFDEMDVIDTEQVQRYADRAAYTFREYMRALMDSEQRVGYIFVVGRRPEELDESFNAQLFRGCVQKRIGHLSQAETDRLATEPAREYLAYSPESLAAIFALTAGHPFCTQVICQQLWGYCLRRAQTPAEYPAAVSPEAVNAVLPEALTYGELGLNWIYDGIEAPGHRLFLSAAAEALGSQTSASLTDIVALLRSRHISLPEPELQAAQADLVRWDILQTSPAERYRFTVEMIRAWVADRRSVERMAHEARLVSRRAYQLYELADGYRQDGQLAEAVDNYRKALGINPQLVDAQVGLADALRSLEDWPGAVEAYERLRELVPERVSGLQQTLLSYGQSLERADQLSEAIQQYARADELAEDRTVRSRLDRAVARLGQQLIAKERFDEALGLFERHGYDHEADLAEKQRLAVVNAIEAPIQAMLKQPASQVQAGAWQAAADHARQYAEQNPSDKNLRALVETIAQQEELWHLERGDLHMAAAEYARALEEYRQTADRDRIAQATQQLEQANARQAALNLEAGGEPDDWAPAVEAFEKYLARYPEDTEMATRLANARQALTQQRRQQAEALVTQKQGRQAAEAYLALGDQEEAMGALIRVWRAGAGESISKRWTWLRTQFLTIVIGLSVACYISYFVVAGIVGYPLTTVAAGLVVTVAVGETIRLAVSDWYLVRRMHRRLMEELQPGLALDEAERRIRNRDYARRIPGVALAWGLSAGGIGLVLLGGVLPAYLETPGVADFSGDYWLAVGKGVAGTALGAVIGFALTVASYRPDREAATEARLMPDHPRVRRTLVAFGVFVLVASAGLALGIAFGLAARLAEYIAWGVFLLMAVLALTAALQAVRAIRQVLNASPRAKE